MPLVDFDKTDSIFVENVAQPSEQRRIFTSKNIPHFKLLMIS